MRRGKDLVALKQRQARPRGFELERCERQAHPYMERYGVDDFPVWICTPMKPIYTRYDHGEPPMRCTTGPRRADQ